MHPYAKKYSSVAGNQSMEIGFYFCSLAYHFSTLGSEEMPCDLIVCLNQIQLNFRYCIFATVYESRLRPILD